MQNKDKIISDFEAGHCSEAKRKRKHKFDAVDEPLIKWFRCVRDQKIPVSGEMLLLKAQEFARACGCDDTDKLDANWVNRWKSRQEVVCKKLHGEAESVDQCGVDDWQKHRLPALLKQFKAEEIFNTDETGLFYRCLPDRTHVMKNEKCAGGKLSKDRLTVLVTASMAGEKLPPLVIGKSANPRCFKNVKKLPLPYEHNTKAWMTSTIFEKWVKKLDLQMRKRERKIALVLDNCTAHPSVSGLTNVKLVFLPPNTTAKTQPMDAGVIRCFKAHYIKNLAKMRLLAFEEKKPNCKIDVLESMKLFNQAWDSVSETAIKNCFKKVMFVQPELEDNLEETESNVDEDIEGIWERLQAGGLIPETCTFSVYTENDSQLQTRETITESSMLDDLRATGEDITVQKEKEDEEDVSVEEVEPTISSSTEALALMRQLDRYFRSHDDSEEMLRHLTKIQKYVVDKSITKTKQLKINDFFARK